MKRRVVITGLGVVAPNGVGINDFWRNTISGVTGIKEYEWGNRHFQFESKVLGEIVDFEPISLGVPKDIVHKTSRYIQFALATAKMAIDDSKLDLSAIGPARFSISISSAVADASSMEKNLLFITEQDNYGNSTHHLHC